MFLFSIAGTIPASEQDQKIGGDTMDEDQKTFGIKSNIESCIDSILTSL